MERAFWITLAILLLGLSSMMTGSPAAVHGAASESSRSPHGAALTVPCQNCHTAVGWKPIRSIPEFDHSKTKYPLRGLHTNVPCTSCHTKPVFTNVGTKCADCHADIHRGQMGANCESCHSVKGWKADISAIQNHQNRFPLVGAHAMVECDSCHKGAATGQFKGLSTDCYTCHAQQFQQAKAPDHVAAKFPTDCSVCHSINSWAGATFDHSKFAGVACVTCHLPDFQKATNPNHVALNFPQTCQTCHTTVAWQPATFDHFVVGFQIVGAHTKLDCIACHTNNNYQLTTKACVDCHITQYNATTMPNHAQVGKPTTCEWCHNQSTWGGASFDHAATGWPLTGFHKTNTECAQCHSNNNYHLTNTACVACHQTDYNTAKAPVDHIGLKYPTTCEGCHDTTSWTNATFNHASTGFSLTGAHATLQCAQCHVNNNYNLTTAACVSCHQAAYNTAKTPIDHVALNFPTTCEGCHDTVLWTNGKFDHTSTGFPLTGRHASTPCTLCHINNNYQLTNTACVSCHQADYNTAKTPIDHLGLGFPTTCENCHDTVLWTNGKFDHAATGFPLTGKHAATPCALCHVNNNYHLTNTACVSCHQADYNGAKTPIDHIASGFPTICESCHDTIVWADGKFDHAATGWPLTGFHATMQCALCHANNNYHLTNTACVTCHQADYNGAKTPVDHIAAGFPTTCQTCHDTLLWTNGKFDHATTGWPLTGFHATSVTCAQCHINGNYSITNTACVSCHQTDYNNTTNPNHAAAGFPTTCQTCHSTTNWLGAVFNHTYFPQNHGGASTCNTCHTNPSNYLIFSCLGCHEHADKNQVDGNHQGVNGYMYDSVHCYQCHKN